ncbi:hypothetical protein [Motiliproteus coralliicola]|nr:hypothetical protein [Motiliproteus coralliicola]
MAFSLLALMLLVWGSHQFSQTIRLHSLTVVSSADSTEIHTDHQHQTAQSHASLGIEHRHPPGTPDHTHENASVPQPVISPYQPVHARPLVVQAGHPIPPLFRFERPPRFFS